MQISISPDFQNLLPKLDDAELEQHEKNCLADPHHERMPPVLVWENGGNVIVDGHNQYRVRQKYDLKIRYSLLTFASKEEALRHAVDVQFGRRNLDASQRAIIYARLPRLPEGRPDENVANLQRLSQLAEAAKVSKRTMSDAVKVVDNAVADIVEGVQAGDYAASDAAAIADLPEQEQKRISDEAKRTGSTLRQAANSSNGTASKSDGSTIAVTKPVKSGTSVVSGKDRELTLKTLSALCRCMQRLGLFGIYNETLSEMIRRVKELK